MFRRPLARESTGGPVGANLVFALVVVASELGIVSELSGAPAPGIRAFVSASVFFSNEPDSQIELQCRCEGADTDSGFPDLMRQGCRLERTGMYRQRVWETAIGSSAATELANKH